MAAPLCLVGALAERVQAWQAIGASPWSIEVIRLGFLPPWAESPAPLTRHPPTFPPPRDPDALSVLDSEVTSLLRRKAVEAVQTKDSPGFYCRLFSVPKKTGGFRPVLDLSALNKFVATRSFRMETPQSFRHSLRPHDWVTSIDLTDAYFHILIRHAFRKWLRFVWDGVAYQFRALPFGLSLSPWVFTKIVREVIAAVHARGIRMRAYLDDWAIQAHDQELARRHTQQVLSMVAALGFNVNLKKSDGGALTGPHRPSAVVDRVPSEQTDGFRSRTSSTSWLHGVNSAVRSDGRSAQTSSAEGFSSPVDTVSRSVGRPGPSRSLVQTSGPSVVGSGFPVDRCPDHRAGTDRGAVYRCQSNRLGRTCFKRRRFGSMAGGCVGDSHQPAGDASGPLGSPSLAERLSTRSCQDSVGQYDSDCIYQSPRRHRFSRTLDSGGEVHSVGGGSRSVSLRGPHQRQGQCAGRFSKPTGRSGPDGVDSVSRRSAPNLGHFRQASYGPICHTVQHQASSVCFTCSGSSGVGGGCVHDILDGVGRLCVPPIFSHSQGSTEMGTGRTTHDPHCSGLASARVVSRATCERSSQTADFTSAGIVNTTQVGDSARQPSSSASSRLAVVAKGLRDSGASALTRSLVRDAHRSSTKSVYASHWRAWVQWCARNSVDCLRPSAVDLANHLACHSVNKCASAAALRVRRSAVLTTLRQRAPGWDIPLSVSSDVIRGTALRRAGQRKRTPDWDLRVVLDFLVSSEFEPLTEVSVARLTWKTVFLVMLACGRRASEVHALSGLASDIVKERDGSFTLRFLPEFLAKNQNPESQSPSVRIRPLASFADEEDADIRLCPVRALAVYIKRTNSRRAGSLRRLFLPCVATRHRDIYKSTLVSWVRKTIQAAYAAKSDRFVNQFRDETSGGGSFLPLSTPRVHEVRAWSTTLAAQSAKISDVLNAAYWRTPNVFIEFYLRDVTANRTDGKKCLSTCVAAGHVASF